MPRRIKQKPSIISPLMDNFVRRLSQTDQRLRRRFLKIGFILIGIGFGFSLFTGTYSLPRIIRLELERKTLIEANRSELVKLIDAARTRELLLTDRNYIEYLARTRYHMVYQNETIYRYRGQ